MKHTRILLALVACVLLAMWILVLRPGPDAKTEPAAGNVAKPTRLSPAGFEQQAKRLTVALQDGGAETSFILVDKALELNPLFARDCHPLLHRLGQAAYDHYGGFAPAMARAKEVCNSGYIHGVIEAEFAKQPDLATAISTSCPDAQSQTYANWQCFHGVGHGVMYRQANNVATSLKGCETIAGEFARESCANGVFMEAFNLVGHGGEHSQRRSNPGMALCQRESRYVNDCYFYAPVAYLEERGSDYKAALDWCKSAEAYALDCVRGVGSQAMKDNISDPRISADLCAQAARNLREACADGAIGLFVNHHAKTEPAKALCDDVFKAFQSSCQQEIASKQNRFGI